MSARRESAVIEPAADIAYEVSFVIPCLNEEASVAAVVGEERVPVGGRAVVQHADGEGEGEGAVREGQPAAVGDVVADARVRRAGALEHLGRRVDADEAVRELAQVLVHGPRAAADVQRAGA